MSNVPDDIAKAIDELVDNAAWGGWDRSVAQSRTHLNALILAHLGKPEQGRVEADIRLRRQLEVARQRLSEIAEGRVCQPLLHAKAALRIMEDVMFAP